MADSSSNSDDGSLLDSDDDGIGIGDKTKKMKMITIGYATVVFRLHFGRDFEPVLRTVLQKNRERVKVKIEKMTELVQEKKYLLTKAIMWSKDTLTF